jgi:hypothetical protein
MESKKWGIRRDEEINASLKGEAAVRFMASRRLRLVGHVERMEDNAMTKKMIEGKLYHKGRKGGHRMR